MEEGSVSQDVLDKVKKVAADGRLTCPEARRIADEAGVAPKEVGQACNELKIKISGCALGCF